MYRRLPFRPSSELEQRDLVITVATTSRPTILLLADGMFAVGALDLLRRAGLRVLSVLPKREVAWRALLGISDVVVLEAELCDARLAHVRSVSRDTPVVVSSATRDIVSVFKSGSSTPTSYPQDQLVSTVLCLTQVNKDHPTIPTL